MENLVFLVKSSEQISKFYSVCSIIIKQSDLDFVKKRLKPFRRFLLN